MEKDNCSVPSSLAVRVSSTSGFWPADDLFAEIDANTSLKEVIHKAAHFLNLSSIDEFEAHFCQKKLNLNASFKELGLSCLVNIVLHKPEKGGGSNPLFAPKIFEDEVQKLSPTFLGPRGWSIKSSNYPLLEIQFSCDGREDLIVECRCENYPSEAPSYSFKNAQGSFLTQIPGVNNGYINQSAHPLTGKAFVCAAGAREFHTHPSHINERWENYQIRLNEFGILPVLSKIYHVWLGR